MLVSCRIRLAAMAAALVLLGGGPAAVASIQFGPEQLILSGGEAIVVDGFSVPSFVDWDEDDLPDLVVGEGSSFQDGRVRIYPNLGAPGAPLFDGFVYAQQEGGDLLYDGG